MDKVFSAGSMHELNGKQVEVKNATPKGSGPQGAGRGRVGLGAGGRGPIMGGRGYEFGRLQSSYGMGSYNINPGASGVMCSMAGGWAGRRGSCAMCGGADVMSGALSWEAHVGLGADYIAIVLHMWHLQSESRAPAAAATALLLLPLPCKLTAWWSL